ncbi:cytochrome ubiquinol oxidase subunit I [Micropruina sonneratiae]|uniref:cytochrome ubiquinol oxidase subunit I n=1 Tax=Micropruina sonneratiae TaxID=2986940 RepID=UPI0022274FBB|nr:cytochrome ubiquinol oxidase subunit I [Micropruina sp. KQZ13P-5]MCW3159049.1 cytochrome ubiquinol oxidase subunit I [Micropruina sp. KQZ13P-5]
MDPVSLARWQFGITTVYHWFFVPVTLALSIIVAIFQTLWFRSGDDKYLRLTKFYGKLFLINFAMGVVTGIVQEFQFGMNWSEYSRFVGDVFGAPLAFEALLAFFLESTFLGLWIFGWDRLPKKIHLLAIWLAAIGSNISAIFILAANSFMQNPQGAVYNAVTDRAEMADFGAVLTNPVLLWALPHTLMASWLTASALVLAVSGWHLAKLNRADRAADAVAESTAEDAAATDATTSDPAPAKPDNTLAAHRFAAVFAAVAMMVSGVGLVLTGDESGKIMTQVQPMKMAAAEALYETAGGDGSGAPFSILTIGTLDGSRPIFVIEVPHLLSFLATGTWDGKVQGINELKAAYADGQLVDPDNKLQQAYAEHMRAWGVDTHTPIIPVTYWSFRLMIGLGMASIAVALLALWFLRKDGLPPNRRWWTWLMVLTPLGPLFANSFGWIFTEMGRQPWIVSGTLPVSAAVSPGVSAAEVLISLIGYTLVYGALAVIEVRLLLKYIRLGLPDVEPVEQVTDDDDVLSFAY